jgi:hypothetical protein
VSDRTLSIALNGLVLTNSLTDFYELSPVGLRAAVDKVLPISEGRKAVSMWGSRVPPTVCNIHKEVLRYVQYFLHRRARHDAGLMDAKGETVKGWSNFSLRLVKEVSLRLAEESGSQCRSWCRYSGLSSGVCNCQCIQAAKLLELCPLETYRGMIAPVRPRSLA